MEVKGGKMGVNFRKEGTVWRYIEYRVYRLNRGGVRQQEAAQGSRRLGSTQTPPCRKKCCTDFGTEAAAVRWAKSEFLIL